MVQRPGHALLVDAGIAVGLACGAHAVHDGLGFARRLHGLYAVEEVLQARRHLHASRRKPLVPAFAKVAPCRQNDNGERQAEQRGGGEAPIDASEHHAGDEDDGDSACHLGKHVRHPALGDGDVAHEGVGQARLPSFVENPQRKLAYLLGKPRPAFRGNLVAIGEAGVDCEVLHEEGGDEEHPHRRARRPHRRDVRSTRHDLGDDEGQKCERRQLDDVCRSGQGYRLREPVRLAARNAVDHTHFPSPPGVPRRRFDGRLPQAPVHSVLGQELFVRALLDHLAAV